MTTYLRTWALDDIHISRSGDGRTVTAYAAMFDAPYEVRDQHGHYMEQIERSAFNRTLSHGGASRVACLFNHGLTVHGTPDGKLSVPLGTPLEIKPDGRGLLTVTRYNRGEVADLVLESIRNGDIRSQSFRGRIFRSSPDRLPRQRGSALPTVVRHELGLSDYGPTPVPVNAGAEIVAVRSAAQIVDELDHLDDDEREEFLEELARHLSGRHNQGSHGNRFSTPGDRSSGLRREGVARRPSPTGPGRDRAPAKPDGRTFTNRELSGVFGNALDRTGKSGTVNEHRRRLEDAGATPEQSAKILKDLGVDVADEPDIFGNDPNDKRTVDFGNYEGPGRTLADRTDAEARDEAVARQRARLREATPAAYDTLLGANGEQPLLKSKQQRAVFEAMRERGWVMTDVGRGDVSIWSSPDGTERIELSLSPRLGNKVRGFDGEREQSEPLTWGKALERVNAGTAEESSPAAQIAAQSEDARQQRLAANIAESAALGQDPAGNDLVVPRDGVPSGLDRIRDRRAREARDQAASNADPAAAAAARQAAADRQRFGGVPASPEIRAALEEQERRWRRQLAGTQRSLLPDDFLAPDEVLDANTATPDDSGPGAEDPPSAGHSGRLAIRRNRIRAELISLGVIKP